MKKRIGNDIQFTWHIYRKDGDTQTPESFDGKEVEVKLISPLQRPVTIEDVSIATGVVMFTFRGKHQVTLGNYVAILQENRGEDGMVTLDVVNAVTLVAHSYMEEDGDEGDVIEAESVELESSISAGGGGGTPIDAYTKTETDDLFLRKRVVQGNHYAERGLVTVMNNTIDGMGTYYTNAYAGGIIIGHNDNTLNLTPDAINKVAGYTATVSVVWEDTATEQIPTATEQSAGLMSAEDKEKLNNMSDGGSASDIEYDNTRTGLQATNVQDAIDEMADTKLYETVVLTVGSADSTFNPVGQTITVTLEDGSATQYTVPYSRQISFIVQRGMRYTISGTSTEDYRVLPLSVKAAIPTRYLTMRYIPIATGVFILQRDGNYYLRQEYDAETMAEDAVGVLVLTSALIDAGFGLVLGNDSYVNKAWDASRRSLVNASYCPYANTDSRKYTLYNGLSATTYLNSLGGYAAAEYCWSKIITLDDGSTLQGVLGAPAEHKSFLDNINEVNLCLNLIGFPTKSQLGEWTSWQWSSSDWYTRCLTPATGNAEEQSKPTRPIYYYELS